MRSDDFFKYTKKKISIQKSPYQNYPIGTDFMNSILFTFIFQTPVDFPKDTNTCIIDMFYFVLCTRVHFNIRFEIVEFACM